MRESADTPPPANGDIRIMKAVVGFLVARPLVAIAIAAVVVGILLLSTHHQTTPVTHRSQHVGLTDAQQMQLGSQEYAKTLRTNRARIVSSGPGTLKYNGSQAASSPSQAVTSRIRLAGDADQEERGERLLAGGKIVVYTDSALTENDAGSRRCSGTRLRCATAEHVAERIERNHLTEVAAAIIAGGVAFTPAQFVRITALLGVGSACRSAARRSPGDHRLIYMASRLQPHQAVAF